MEMKYQDTVQLHMYTCDYSIFSTQCELHTYFHTLNFKYTYNGICFAVNNNCRVVEGGPVLPSECGQFCLGTSCGCADSFNILVYGQCEGELGRVLMNISVFVHTILPPHTHRSSADDICRHVH